MGVKIKKWKEPYPEHTVGFRAKEPLLDTRILDAPGKDGCIVRVLGIVDGVEYWREAHISRTYLYSKSAKDREKLLEGATHNLRRQVLKDMSIGEPYNPNIASGGTITASNIIGLSSTSNAVFDSSIAIAGVQPKSSELAWLDKQIEKVCAYGR